MIQIGQTLISDSVFNTNFICDLDKCKGACCIGGVSGAPLEDNEIDIIENLAPIVLPMLADANQHAVKEFGMWYIDNDGDMCV